MKKLSAVLFLAVAFCVSAEVLPDIPYYEKDAPPQGNVEYRTQRCKLNLSIPDGVKNFPAIVYFHGGGLSSGGANPTKFPTHFDLS